MEVRCNRKGSDGKLVLFDKHKKVGYLEYDYPARCNNQNVDLDYIYIEPKYRRKGYATFLLSYFLKKFKHKRWINLWTSKDIETIGAYKLYQHFGFTQKVLLEDYFEKGIPIRLFVKRINPS
jgi:ribosomal protein S18 acetylase RimI-like enzyme